MLSYSLKRAASKGAVSNALYAQTVRQARMIPTLQMHQYRASSTSFSKPFGASQILKKPLSQADNFVNGTSAVYVDTLFEQWLEDPNSVHSSWRAYFSNIDSGKEVPYTPPPQLGKIASSSGSIGNIDNIISALQQTGLLGGTISEVGGKEVGAKSAQSDAFKIMSLIRAFYMYGHLIADLDPLNLDEVYSQSNKAHKSRKEHSRYVDYQYYGFTE